MGKGSNTVLGSTHLVEQLSFSMFLSIFGVGVGFNIDLGSTHVVEQLSFPLFLSILTFDFDSILGSFLTFWGPNGLFLGL